MQADISNGYKISHYRYLNQKELSGLGDISESLIQNGSRNNGNGAASGGLLVPYKGLSIGELNNHALLYVFAQSTAKDQIADYAVLIDGALSEGIFTINDSYSDVTKRATLVYGLLTDPQNSEQMKIAKRRILERMIDEAKKESIGSIQAFCIGGNSLGPELQRYKFKRIFSSDNTGDSNDNLEEYRLTLR